MRLKNLLFSVLLAMVSAVQAGQDIRMTSELEEIVALYKRGDYQAAFKGFSREARKGEAFAQAMLGKMYADGQGTPQNDALALEWLTRAAKRGDALAQNRLGFMYTEGQGVAQDLTMAAFFYREAAEQYNANACYSLAKAYDEGLGVTVDHEAALRYYKRAARLGNLPAQSELDSRSE